MRTPFYKKVISFCHAMIAWTLDGFRIPSKVILNNRKVVCMGDTIRKKCNSWNQSAYFGIGGCNECGCCKLKLYVKASSCPLNKW